MIITDRDRLNAVDVGLAIAKILYRLYPKDFEPGKMEHLLLDAKTLAAIKTDKSLKEIHDAWQPAVEEFQKRRAKYLIY